MAGIIKVRVLSRAGPSGSIEHPETYSVPSTWNFGQLYEFLASERKESTRYLYEYNPSEDLIDAVVPGRRELSVYRSEAPPLLDDLQATLQEVIPDSVHGKRKVLDLIARAQRTHGELDLSQFTRQLELLVLHMDVSVEGLIDTCNRLGMRKCSLESKNFLHKVNALRRATLAERREQLMDRARAALVRLANGNRQSADAMLAEVQQAVTDVLPGLDRMPFEEAVRSQEQVAGAVVAKFRDEKAQSQEAQRQSQKERARLIAEAERMRIAAERARDDQTRADAARQYAEQTRMQTAERERQYAEQTRMQTAERERQHAEQTRMQTAERERVQAALDKAAAETAELEQRAQRAFDEKQARLGRARAEIEEREREAMAFFAEEQRKLDEANKRLADIKREAERVKAEAEAARREAERQRKELEHEQARQQAERDKAAAEAARKRAQEAEREQAERKREEQARQRAEWERDQQRQRVEKAAAEAAAQREKEQKAKQAREYKAENDARRAEEDADRSKKRARGGGGGGGGGATRPRPFTGPPDDDPQYAKYTPERRKRLYELRKNDREEQVRIWERSQGEEPPRSDPTMPTGLTADQQYAWAKKKRNVANVVMQLEIMKAVVREYGNEVDDAMIDTLVNTGAEMPAEVLANWTPKMIRLRLRTVHPDKTFEDPEAAIKAAKFTAVKEAADIIVNFSERTHPIREFRNLTNFYNFLPYDGVIFPTL